MPLSVCVVDGIVIQYNETLAERPVRSRVAPGYLKKLLPNSAPEEGEEWEEIQKDIESKIMPGMNHWYVDYFQVAMVIRGFASR